MATYLNIRPEDWVRRITTNDGVDTPVGLGVKYIGSAASGIITLAATTGDMTFEHGVLSSEAVDATIGTAGVLDLTTYTTIQSLLRNINASPNWEAWAIDLPGDYLTNISAGNGIFTAAGVVAAPAKVDGGLTASFVVDTSLKTAEDFACGLTFNGQSSEPHGSDAQVLHEILKIVALATFGGATDGVYIYECDDVAGTKTEVAHLPLVTATITTFGTGDEPIYSSKGKRLVVMAVDASGAITVPRIDIYSRSYAFGPAIRKSKLYSEY